MSTPISSPSRIISPSFVESQLTRLPSAMAAGPFVSRRWNNILPWLFVGLLWLMGLVSPTGAKVILMGPDGTPKATYLSYDFQGDTVPYYVRYGPLIHLELDSDCQWPLSPAVRESGASSSRINNHMRKLKQSDESTDPALSSSSDASPIELPPSGPGFDQPLWPVVTDSISQAELDAIIQPPPSSALVEEQPPPSFTTTSPSSSPPPSIPRFDPAQFDQYEGTASAFNSTTLFFHQPDLIQSGCRSYIEVLKQSPQIIKSVRDAGYPTPNLFLFSTLQTSTDNFGFVDTDVFDNYHKHWQYVPKGVYLAVVSRGTGIMLKDEGVLVAKVIEDPGVWNRFIKSPLWLACRIIDFVMGLHFNIRIFIFLSAIFFMIVALAIPMGRPASYVEIIFRYSSWMFGFTGANIIIVSWTRIVVNICKLRFVQLLYFVCALHVAVVVIISMSSVIYMLVRSLQIIMIIMGVARYGMTSVITAQALLMLIYCSIFIYRIYHMPMSTYSRFILIRLTVLILCVAVGMVLNMVTWVIFFQPETSPGLVATRNILFSFCVFFLFGTVFYFLRVRDHQRDNSTLCTGDHWKLESKRHTRESDISTAADENHSPHHI
ncbi:hypothetical protein BJ085DRAFT_39161 [Dimargaris cristalligena]|uniref:Uncharacterized protein n=1 Tax=Dimargaris cristalligena TaxID=215637 RepID=A0A4P9ZP81_9FUNG|nr:hypothetical protein BJ085DRAFT_39161 [Dimargaris cristalligena]|eukprot:RKP34441.1 hypothetical protein BJ085DRAFT_39161 [Dimargaris cristalligena]